MEANKLERLPTETELDYHKRIIFGKLVDKTLVDEDYIELSKYVYGKEYSSDVARRMFYGSKRTLDIMEKEQESKMSKSKLQEVKEVIGELDIKKRETQLKTNELNKIKRELIKSVVIAEDLKDYLRENSTISIPDYCYSPITITNNYKMIVHITDLHIGSIIRDCKGNNFNWEIANDRINKLIDECYKYINLYNIQQVYVINTGDIVEHTYMRKNQNQYCEFGQATQINKAIQLIYRFLVALCKKCNVEYDSIAGNHDRMSGELAVNYDGDNADTIIHEQIKEYCNLSGNKRLQVVNRDYCDKEIIKNINDIKCKFIHGDIQTTKDEKTLLKNEMSMDNEFYNILFKGHLHNFNIVSENNGRYIVTTGCLSGFNDYSTRFGCSTVASQTICVIGDEIELIKDVKLA